MIYYYNAIDGLIKITNLKDKMALKNNKTSKPFGISMLYNKIAHTVNIYFNDLFFQKATKEEIEKKEEAKKLNEELRKIEKFLKDLQENQNG